MESLKFQLHVYFVNTVAYYFVCISLVGAQQNYQEKSMQVISSQSHSGLEFAGVDSNCMLGTDDVVQLR